jgi:hypothetical protein
MRPEVGHWERWERVKVWRQRYSWVVSMVKGPQKLRMAIKKEDWGKVEISNPYVGGDVEESCGCEREREKTVGRSAIRKEKKKVVWRRRRKNRLLGMSGRIGEWRR